jgi:sulfur dioxygenase
MQIRQLFDRESSTYSYLLVAGGEAALIDPVREQVERDLALVRELGVRLTHTIETHVHADHVTAAGIIRERTGARTAASAAGAPCVDIHLHHGNVIRIGREAITALATPGHTDDGLSLAIPGAVFTGDTLLVRSCGRADFQNGNASQLYHSITSVLFTLPDDTIVYPGHDYNGYTITTIGEERRFNSRIAGRTHDEFITVMSALGLPAPRKLAESVPANRACGQGPTQ